MLYDPASMSSRSVTSEWPPDVDAFAARFAECTIPREEWTHLAHLIVGLWHLHRFGPEEALRQLRVGIRRLNESHGTLNTATGGYHETITRAYVALLSDFDRSCPAEMSLGARVTQLLNSQLAERDVLLKFFSRERLMSPHARAYWVEPDIAPLRL